MGLPKHKSQATRSGGSTLGQAGKPQFITKMENDTSLCVFPRGGLIYDCTRAGTFVSAARHERVCRGTNSVLLATGVKDALQMGYLLLFIRKAPAWQQGPCPLASPLPCHLSLLSSQSLEEVEGSFLGLRPCRRE